jgi:hypothetical protein
MTDPTDDLDDVTARVRAKLDQPVHFEAPDEVGIPHPVSPPLGLEPLTSTDHDELTCPLCRTYAARRPLTNRPTATPDPNRPEFLA